MAVLLRYFLAFAFSIVFLAPTPRAYADAPLAGTAPAQWRVVWTDDPATTATISWNTQSVGRDHSVRYHVKGSDEVAAVSLAETGRYTDGSFELYYHHVKLTDLQPATAYEIVMVSDGEQSPVFYFVTAPDTDREFSIMHGGDSRSDRDARRRMNTMISKMVEASFDNDDPSDDVLALAHGGDYVVTGPKVELWSAWLSDHELTTATDGRLLPIIPARGNHDKGKPFNEVFGFPDDDRNYYAISIGPQVRMVTLNSETSAAGDQAAWLGDELSDSRGSHRWLLAQYHRPVYPAVKTPGSGLKAWVPLFEKFNVDLVCEADGHNIKRTVPIRNGKNDPTGVVYIGEGGLGVAQRTPKTDRWFLQSPGMADQGNHVFVLTFGKDTLRGKCVLEGGEIRDEFTRNVR
ncbi:MAG: metallophosphoesterase family protein [Rubripirellula sp.]